MMAQEDRKFRKKNLQITGKSLKSPTNDSAHAFLNFAPENLSISHSDIEQGFNMPGKCLKLSKSRILSCSAICIAILCFAFEIFKFRKVLDNSRNIENLRKDMEALRNRFFEEDFLNELKAFEQQSYAEDGESGDSDIDGDYDSNYDDYENDRSDYSDDTATSTTKKTEIAPKLEKLLQKQKRSPNESPVAKNEPGEDSVILETSDIEDEPEEEWKKNKPKKSERRRKHFHKYRKSVMKKPSRSRTTKSSLCAPGNVFAAHYEADYMLSHVSDGHKEKTNHHEGIFTAWKSSEWMNDLEMNQYFTLSRNGKLKVHEAGVYLIYAQIHYLNEYDENGFHILVNDQPILQCMVFTPGTENKSRSCYSSQVTYLHSNDQIIVKDVRQPSYKFFQREKSFFGLAKIGEISQRNSTHPR